MLRERAGAWAGVGGGVQARRLSRAGLRRLQQAQPLQVPRLGALPSRSSSVHALPLHPAPLHPCAEAGSRSACVHARAAEMGCGEQGKLVAPSMDPEVDQTCFSDYNLKVSLLSLSLFLWTWVWS
eukprot:2544639-Rhodomonas_salina.1